MEGFENVEGLGEVLRGKFTAFVNLVSTRKVDNPILSPEIERTLDIRGPSVRALRHAAWTLGFPIASSGRGYYWAKTADDWRVVVEHITHRYNAERANLDHVRVIADRLARAPIIPPAELQTTLFGEG